MDILKFEDMQGLLINASFVYQIYYYLRNNILSAPYTYRRFLEPSIILKSNRTSSTSYIVFFAILSWRSGIVRVHFESSIGVHRKVGASPFVLDLSGKCPTEKLETMLTTLLSRLMEDC